MKKLKVPSGPQYLDDIYMIEREIFTKPRMAYLKMNINMLIEVFR